MQKAELRAGSLPAKSQGGGAAIAAKAIELEKSAQRKLAGQERSGG